MKKLLITISSLVALVLLLAIAAIAYVLTFDANENKDWIAARFKAATGRDLTLNGDIDFTLYPWLGLTLNDVGISNADGFSTTPLLQADHAEVRIKLMPLFNDAYEIDTVRLHGAQLNLEVLGNGANNWTFATDSAPDDTGDTDTAGEDSGANLNNLIVAGVDIQDTSLVYDNQMDNTHYEISGLNLTIGDLVYGEPLDILMSLEGSSRAPELGTTLNLEGVVVYDVDNGRYDLDPLTVRGTLQGPGVPTGSADINLATALSINLNDDTLSLGQLELTALDTTLTASLEASRIRTDTPAFTGDLNLSGNDLAALFRIVEQDELAQRISSLDSNFDITVSVDADMDSGTVNLPALQASLLGADITGKLAASRINSDAPAINGTLAASGPDLPTLIEVAGMLQGGTDAPLSQYGRDLSRVPDKAFRVQTTFDADMQSGMLDVPELYASLLGATMTGNLTGSNIHTDTPQLRGQLNAQGPDLPLLMQIAGQLQGGPDAALNQYGQKLRSGLSNRAFTLSTDFDADLEQGNIQLPTLTAAMLGFRLNGNLDAENMQRDNGSVSGALELQGENLRDVLTALEQPGLAAVARSLTLDVGINGNSSNLRLSPFTLRMVVGGPQIANGPQTLALAADTVLNLDNDSLQLDAFSIQGLGLDLSGSLSASNISESASFEGRLEQPVFNARQLLQQLNLDMPQTADSSTLQRTGLSTIFSGTANSVELSEIAITLDDSLISGSLAVSDFSTLSSRFDINVDRIDVDRYLAPPGESEAAESSEAAEPLPVDRLKTLDLQGALNIGELTISGLQMRDIVVQANARNGDLALNPVSAALYDGSITAEGHLNVNGPQPAATVATRLNMINLEPLLQDFMDATYLTGNGNIELSLSGSGTDAAAILGNLNGDGSISLEQGVLDGVDVADVLGRIETMIRERRLVELPQGGQTPFDNFSATLAISDGVVGTSDLLIEAPGWKLAGAGTLVDLSDDTIDFNMVTTVVPETVPEGQQYTLSGNTLPIACTGSLSSPRCLPDAQAIITAAVGNAVQRRLGDFLQDRLGTPPAEEEANPQQAAPEETPPPEADPAQELINRALKRLLE